MNNYIVYIHIFPNDKLYIGITDSIKNRWRNNGCGYKSQKFMWRAIQKYGWDNIEHIVLLENLSKEVACECEKYLIAKYKTNNPEYGYNIYIGGDCGPVGIPKSEETKNKLSKANLGHKHSQKTIDKIKQNHAHYNRGRHISESQKLKISKANKGKIPWNKGMKMSKQHCEKLSKSHLGKSPSNKGVPCSDEVKQKIRLANLGKIPWNKGAIQPESVKQKISNSLKNRVWVNNGINRTLVSQEEVQNYLDRGYMLGRGHKENNSE